MFFQIILNTQYFARKARAYPDGGPYSFFRCALHLMLLGVEHSSLLHPPDYQFQRRASFMAI